MAKLLPSILVSYHYSVPALLVLCADIINTYSRGNKLFFLHGAVSTFIACAFVSVPSIIISTCGCQARGRLHLLYAQIFCITPSFFSFLLDISSACLKPCRLLNYLFVSILPHRQCVKLMGLMSHMGMRLCIGAKRTTTMI